MNAPETRFHLRETTLPFEGTVEMVHGSGGRATAELVRSLFYRHFDAALIGEVVADPHAFISMKTRFGGSRMVDWLAGDPLPRIC
jgi:hydrogenase maturation factor